MVPNWMPQVPRRRGRKPRVPLDQILQALTFHVAEGAGTLAEHFFELFQEPLADSSWSDRRRHLPWEIFADLMRRALRPIATRRRNRRRVSLTSRSGKLQVQPQRDARIVVIGFP